MKSRVLLYTALLFAMFSASCSKEDRFTPEQEPELKESTISYTVAVKDGTATRASLNGTSYIFQAEDKLYVTGDGGNVHGILNLVSGAGTSSATFSGDLSYPSGDEPSPTLIINATLVSATDKIHDITTNPGFVNATTYPTSVNAIASSLQEAVEWYSDFTAESEYAKKSFTLHQNSAFLNFTVKYVDLPETILDETIDHKTVAINFTNHHASSLTPDPASSRSGSMVLKKDGEDIVTNFVAAFPDGTDLNKAVITVQVGGGEYPERPFYLTDATLAGNKKYNVSRISSSEFAVQTREDNTTIKFNHVSSGDGAQYKLGNDAWADYSPGQVITVASAETVVLFRSKRTDTYENQIHTPGKEFPDKGNNPIFTFSKKVYIFGDIMSLKCTGDDDEYIRGTSIQNELEFGGAFWGINNIEIHPNRFFVLSAQNLTPYCYQNMFRENTSITTGKHIIISAYKMAPFCCNGMFKKCTAFTSAPVIKATVLAESCCQSMFENCKLSVVPDLPATQLAVSCYRQMFASCSNLVTVPNDLLSHVTNLEPYCYFSMFYKCSNLTNAPDLPAETLVSYCYETMFAETNVSSVKCLATNPSSAISNNPYTKGWLSGVPATGTFTMKDGVTTWTSDTNGIPSGWTVVEE